MRAETGCYFTFTVPCGEITDIVDEIRASVGSRTVYLDIPLDATMNVSSTIYFFADLNPSTSKPEVLAAIWIKNDLEVLRDELKRNPPACVIKWGGNMTPMLLDIFASYTTVPVRNGFVYCRI